MNRYVRLTIFLILFLSIPRLYSHGQNSTNFTIELTVKEFPTEKFITQLDSLILHNVVTGERRIFTNFKSTDNNYKITGIPIGKYSIRPYKEGMGIAYDDISVCTLCKNKMELFAFHITSGNFLFDKVWFDPHYKAGFKQESIDFLSALTEDEKKTLRNVGEKLIVNCFVTTDGKLSDLVFSPADLPEQTKKIIQKGLEKLSWMPAIGNGKICDDNMIIPIYKMLE